MNKKTIFVTFLMIIGLFWILLFRTNNGYKNPVSPTPTVPLVSEKPLLEAMTTAFSKKYARPADAFIVTVDTNMGPYAKGSIRFREEGDGGIWFAANVHGRWQLIYDGNGIIPCRHILLYPDFPSSLIPHCFDDTTQTLIKR